MTHKKTRKLLNKILCGDSLEVLKTFPDGFVDCIITSPPYYGLRDFGVKEQIGLEKTLDEYLDRMLKVTAELKRVLKKTGTMWWNHGDSYASLGKTGGDFGKDGKISRGLSGGGRIKKGTYPEKSLLLQAHRLAIRMIDEQGWILRNQIIWHKPNCMPSSVKDRFTVDFEPIFFFTKNKKYWFEQQFEKYTEPMNRWGGEKLEAKGKSEWDEGTGQESYRDRNMRPNPEGRSKRTVWKIPTKPYPEAHFAVYPEKLIETPIKAGCPEMICKECGVIREKIYYRKYFKTERKPAPNKGEIGSKGIEGQAAHMTRDGFIPNRKNEIKELGMTDCGCNAGWDKGIVLDPFMGSGTAALVARNLGRNYVGIELNSEYIKLAEKRLAQQKLI